MSTGNNLEEIYSNSIKILKDLIAFKTISGEDNNQLIDYCDEILKKNGASSFKTYDKEKKRVQFLTFIYTRMNSLALEMATMVHITVNCGNRRCKGEIECTLYA